MKALVKLQSKVKYLYERLELGREEIMIMRQEREEAAQERNRCFEGEASCLGKLPRANPPTQQNLKTSGKGS